MSNVLTNTNLSNLQVDGVSSQLTIQNAPSVGPTTGTIYVEGGGNYGPLNTLLPFADSPSCRGNFGNDTISTNSLVRAAERMMPECQSFFGQRIDDGTSAASVITAACAGAYASLSATVGGTIAAGDSLSLQAVDGAVTVNIGPVTAVSGDTAQTFAQKLSSAANSSAACSGPNAFLEPSVVVTDVIWFAAAKPGTGGNAITIQGTATGTTTITPTVATNLAGGGAASGTFNTFVDKYTGSLPNGAASATYALQGGNMAAAPIFSVAFQFPGKNAQTFSGIVGSATATGPFDASTLQTNLANAVNGKIANIPPSTDFTFVAGVGTQPPVLGTAQYASGGTDGTSGITTSDMIGLDGITGRTGLYNMRGQVSSSQVVLAGLTDPSAGQTLITFRREENCLIHLAFPIGTTTQDAIAIRQAYNLADGGLVLSMDWDLFYNADTGQDVYTSPEAKVAGIIAGVPIQNSPGNQPQPNGAGGIISTERIINGISTIGTAEAALRQQNGILYLGYPPFATRGPQLGLPHGMSSDGVTRISDARVGLFMVQFLQDTEGLYVDGNTDTSASNLGQPTWGELQRAVTGQLAQMKSGTPQVIADFGFLLGSQNTSTSVGQGYLIPSVLITTTSKAQFILNLLSVGPNVQANVTFQ